MSRLDIATPLRYDTYMAYTKHVEYLFTVCGERFAVSWIDDTTLFVEETRKNGQEDCHMCGELHLEDGKWVWKDRWARDQFVTYGNDGIADAIPAYINANPVPK